MLFLGSRAQQSQGLVTARGLRPERFTDEARKERTAQLDFATHRVRFSDGATATADIGDDAQDRLGVFVQLGALIAAAPQDYPRGTRIRFETVGVRHVDPWTFEVQGPEVLHLPAGDTPRSSCNACRRRATTRPTSCGWAPDSAICRCASACLKAEAIGSICNSETTKRRDRVRPGRIHGILSWS